MCRDWETAQEKDRAAFQSGQGADIYNVSDDFLFHLL